MEKRCSPDHDVIRIMGYTPPFGNKKSINKATD